MLSRIITSGILTKFPPQLLQNIFEKISLNDIHKLIAMKSFLLTTAFVITVAGVLFSFIRHQSGERIVFESEKLYPEGITYDDQKELIYLTSMATGKIVSVDQRGQSKVVCGDPRLISTVGIKFNPVNGKLYAANSDIGLSSKTNADKQFKIAQVAIVNPATSKVEDIIELADLAPGKNFANDLTLDKSGNVYVTDSYAHVIYKVDKQKKKSLFAQSPLFKPDSATIGLNGIVWHEEVFLLVIKSVSGELLKVSVKDPSHVEKVKLAEPLVWGDGLYFVNPNELVVVRNRFNKTAYLRTKDHWQSAEVVKEETGTDLTPTTVAVSKKGKVFVTNSKLAELREKKTTSKQFVIDVF
ncbi:MAG: gluconolaconase [Chitinophagaceae bacterium]|nr:gluconolaconase [Chitinophagaceae bacterium]